MISTWLGKEEWIRKRGQGTRETEDMVIDKVSRAGPVLASLCLQIPDNSSTCLRVRGGLRGPLKATWKVEPIERRKCARRKKLR